ncbi:MAG: DivIVA domain-containing protein [Atopobiaceae bacterium]|nr:DivIVA domain-containing protein [Atopobiaceae bacterium]
MAITRQDIEQHTFSPDKKHGYDTAEVDAFLEHVANEIDDMYQKIADLKGRLTNSEQQLAASQAQVEQMNEQLRSLPSETVAVPMSDVGYGASERQISQALIAAQQTADTIVAEAQETAENIRTDAEQKAREVIRQALADKQKEQDEIDRLKTSREEFRAEYKSLLQHFMDDAETAFPNSAFTSSASVTAPSAPVSVTPVQDSSMFAPAPVQAYQAQTEAQSYPAEDIIDDLD